ncbi:MAG: flagellar biosynthesis anti-sigma factor FlgM [Curvibacter sp.]
MKVGQPADMPKVTSPAQQAGAGAAAPAKKEAAATATSTASSAGVAVTVSASVRSLEQANRGESAADVDMDKVNAVRQAIEDGSYVVNPEAIADKLLANAQEMLDRPRN